MAILLTLFAVFSVCHGHVSGVTTDNTLMAQTMATAEYAQDRTKSEVSSTDSTSPPVLKTSPAEVVTNSLDDCHGDICQTSVGNYLVNTALCGERRWVAIAASPSIRHFSVLIQTDPTNERQETACTWGITVPNGYLIKIELHREETEHSNFSLVLLSEGYKPGQSHRVSLLFDRSFSFDSSLCFYYTGGHPNVTFSLKMSFYLTKTDKDTFKSLPNVTVSDTLGYVTSPVFNGIEAFITNVYKVPAFFIIRVPDRHSVITSFAHFSLLENGADYLSLSMIHTNLTVTEVWTKRKNQLIPSQTFRASIRLYASLEDKGSDTSNKLSLYSIGFKMMYVIVSRSEELVPVAENLFNCSVPSFSNVKPLFQCNLLTECVGGEDEEGCEAYSEDCGQGAIDAGTKCYTLAKPDKRLTWNDAKTECAKHGHQLVTFATLKEWNEFRRLLAFSKLGLSDVYIGLRLADRTGSIPLTALYRHVWEWVDQRSAFNFFIGVYNGDEPYQSDCAVYVQYLGVVSKTLCWSFQMYQFVCEFHKYDRNKQMETPKWISVKDINDTSFKIRVKSCPSGHVTRDFLSCDPESQCEARDYMESCKIENTETPLFLCESGHQTVHYTVVCDHVQHCWDNSDENFCEYQACPAGFQPCKNKQCVANNKICDGILHCSDGSDELCYINKIYVTYTNISLSPGVIFPDRATIEIHGKVILRPMNISDECEPTHFQCLDGHCLPVYLRCNGVDDCLGREDEVACDSYTCPGYYRCRGSAVCLHPDHVCDGVVHCPQLDDEMLCEELLCPEVCHCQGLAFVCNANFSASSFPALRYLDASNSGVTPRDLVHNFYLIRLRLSNNGIDNVPTMTFPNLKHLDLSRNTISGINMQSFRFLKNLRVLVLSKNPLQWISNTATDRAIENIIAVYGVDQLNVNPEKSHTMDLPLQSIDLSQTRLEVYNDTVFSSCPYLKVLNISGSKYQTIVVTNDGFKSTPNLQVLDMKGSRLQRFPNDLLRSLTSLRLVYTENYKLCCKSLLPARFNVDNCHTKEDLLASCEDLLRSNLYRVALWTLASTAVVGNAGSLAARLYRCKDGHFRGSFTVFVINLALADLFMGVYLTIVGVADHIYRGKYLLHDDQWKNSVACNIAGFLSLMSSEVSAFTICLITLDRFLVLRFPFSTLHFNRCSALVACCSVWLLGIILAATPLLPFTSHWDFYSQTGICIPLPFSAIDRFQGQQYSFGLIIVMNFVLFLLIAVGQVLIYRTVQATSRAISRNRESQETIIARRLTTIVVSDFLCWFPIGLLGLLASTGTPIPGEVSVAVVIFVLPLNSALNPFLYTFNSVMEKRRKKRLHQLMENLEMRFHSKLTRENAGSHLKTQAEYQGFDGR